MVFSSFLFLFGFLPLFLVLYFCTPIKYRNYTVLISSYFFYAWGAPIFSLVLFFSNLVDYWISKAIYKFKNNNKKQQLFLVLSLIMNVGLLAYFKYANFFIKEFDNLLELGGFSGIHWTYIALPIGISFFTFQKISYVIDVYKETVKPAEKFTIFALYVVLFPQLIAGPIIRYHDIAKQLKYRTYTSEKIIYGIVRFTIGLSKKVLIADVVGKTADIVFAMQTNDITSLYAWIGIFAYTMQIYFDFSGYSDMAIGLGSIMGFTFLENFNKPYIARSFTEFWRRWHISLSNWMKEYLYIPLGGNRGTKTRTFINLWVVFLISGLWHGASWTFVVWGIYHGIFLIVDRLFWNKFEKKVHKTVSISFTFFFIMIGWVFFRSETIGMSIQYIYQMFTPFTKSSQFLFVEIINNRTIVALIFAFLISFIPTYIKLYNKLVELKENKKIFYIIAPIVSFILFFFSVITLANSGFNPFIYFRF
ncbi:MAG: MBOAT family protein [Candidatus Magasanikbacteria bacterium CG_4_9_14_3_um_filter_32_9]|uniref:MBOAT family protein n=1 Tax=Candidatus Magasanikbacteria bacterium CG_4_9_14_3_um_filter_32_9 TaxID=1974644 RepID=A0A2M7Z6Q0_9BACT|nr:MAG: MBOAT family protein [Candidatus Magasanikbacteria bacterium CG_4_9_14_3_um_filter_32_9]